MERRRERRGRKEGKETGSRAKMNIGGRVLVVRRAKMVAVTALAAIHHNPCLVLYVPPKFSLPQNVCVSSYPYNNVLFFWEASRSLPCPNCVYSTVLAPLPQSSQY